MRRVYVVEMLPVKWRRDRQVEEEKSSKSAGTNKQSCVTQTGSNFMMRSGRPWPVHEYTTVYLGNLHTPTTNSPS
jgi:hypothetical protein